MILDSVSILIINPVCIYSYRKQNYFELNNYCVYTYDNGEWKYLIEPIWTYSDHFYTDMNKGADIVERANQSGYVTVRFSDIRNDDFCIVDTLIPIAPHSIISQE